MALQIDKVLDNGVSVSYFKVSRVVISGNNVRIDVDVYVSQVARASGASIVTNCSFNVPIDEFLVEPALKVAYNHLKSLQEFSGSSDV